MSRFATGNAAALLLLMCVFLAGCNSGKDAGSNGSAEDAKKSQQQAADKIKSDPNIPPEAKAAIAGAMNNANASGQQAGQGQGKSTAKTP